jgi:hypothetical protein
MWSKKSERELLAVLQPPTLDRNQFHSKPLHCSDGSKGAGDASCRKQTRLKTSNAPALTYSSKGKKRRSEIQKKEKRIKEGRKDEVCKKKWK